MALDGKVRDIIDFISRTNGFGALSESGTNSLYGINHRGIGSPIPQNTDVQGLTFFTRPRLNLSYDNLVTDRVFTPLMTSNDKSYQRAVRCMLDPDSARPSNIDPRSQKALPPVQSRHVDELNPFIPMLQNHLLSLSGWPDPSFSFFTSKEGMAKEQWGMIDDAARNFGTYTLNGTFRNIAGDPITLLFNIWTRYAARVYDGTMLPYPEMIVDNEIDYHTRIYRLVLDPSHQFVQKIAACGACFPTGVSLGSSFNVASDGGPYNKETNSQISVPFQCFGVDYNDPILINEFNALVMYYNKAMRDQYRESSMQKLRPGELMFFNYFGYPRIDPKTMEIQWWIFPKHYQELQQYPELFRDTRQVGDQNNTLSNDPKNTQVGYDNVLVENIKNGLKT